MPPFFMGFTNDGYILRDHTESLFFGDKFRDEAESN